MKIFITGATGFIGSKVLNQLLESNAEITVLSSREIPGVHTVPSRNYQFDENYLAEQGCADVEVLLHIGAYIPKKGSEANDLEKTTGNISSTMALLEAKWGALKKIVFISTVDVYGSYDGVIDENSPTIPDTLYGWSKLYGEQMIKNFCQQNALDCEILRLGHVYGRGEEVYRKAMPVMIDNALHGNDIQIFGDGKAIRTFIHVNDVVNAIVNAVELDGFNLINVVGNEETTINELAEKIVKFSGADIKIIHKEYSVPNRNLRFNNHRLMTLLLPRLTSFDDGLRDEISYMKEMVHDNI
jgi:UDP-glucose 4-epimerase